VIRHMDRISGWGRFPSMQADIFSPRSAAELSNYFKNAGESFQGISRGLGRSYGDSSLANHVIQTRHLDNFISFDEEAGILCCNAGVTLGTILDNFAARGWFLPVVPGTRFVTVGGAIASDVHGKNHHLDGSFSNHLVSLRLLLASGEVISCSESEHAEIYHATCGGMGLTGVVVDATLQLRRISSAFINQQSIKTSNLRDCFDQIEAHNSAHYSVAWLDCMAQGEELGRALLFLGEHCSMDQRNERDERRNLRNSTLNVPFTTPAMLLNRYSMRLFNRLYYKAAGRPASSSRIHYKKYFFPLDSISNWNRLYGGQGFLQYQFVLPPETAYEGIHKVLSRITAAGKGSFLSVLKKFGEANANMLSFPTSGYTLTLDFKYEADLLPLLDQLDSIVLQHGGRLYLAKDARMSEAMFKSSYPRWQEFAVLREKIGATAVFSSLQSQRLGI
jgi:decaprenylphospho-beta-D-ribofuranose 2-oxidase